MCELFAMSSRFPADVRSSLEEFSRRGGLTGPHMVRRPILSPAAVRQAASWVTESVRHGIPVGVRVLDGTGREIFTRPDVHEAA